MVTVRGEEMGSGGEAPGWGSNVSCLMYREVAKVYACTEVLVVLVQCGFVLWNECGS